MRYSYAERGWGGRCKLRLFWSPYLEVGLSSVRKPEHQEDFGSWNPHEILFLQEIVSFERNPSRFGSWTASSQLSTRRFKRIGRDPLGVVYYVYWLGHLGSCAKHAGPSIVITLGVFTQHRRILEIYSVYLPLELFRQSPWVARLPWTCLLSSVLILWRHRFVCTWTGDKLWWLPPSLILVS